MNLKNMSFVDDIDQDLSDFLNKITPHFEESLTRAFKNDTLSIHRQEMKECIHRMDTVIHHIGDTVVEMRKLQLPWVPDFRINQLRAHLGMLCLELHLNLGALKIEGEYEANNAMLQEFLPVAHEGNVTITFNNMAARGRVGLFINEDSLLPENYDIVYETIEVNIRVKYLASNSRTVETEISRNSVDETLGISMWSQLTQTLTELLSRQLRRVLSEFSLVDLFGDKMELFRARARDLTYQSNKIADCLLCSAKDFIVYNDAREALIPNYDIIFRGKPTRVSLGNLRTSQGDLRDLSTLNRHGAWSCCRTRKEMMFFGYFALKDFKHNFRVYEAEYESTKVSGGIKMSIHQNKILLRMKCLMDEKSSEYVIDDLSLHDFRDVDVDISGLASLGWLYPRIVSWTIANFRRQGKKMLEKLTREAFDYAIEKMNKEINCSDSVKLNFNKVT